MGIGIGDRFVHAPGGRRNERVARPPRHRRWERLRLAGAAALVALACGCADEELLQVAIDAAEGRRIEARAKRLEREARWPSYQGLRLGFSFDAAPKAMTRWLVAIDEPTVVADGAFGCAARFDGTMALSIDEMPIPDAGTWTAWVRPLTDSDAEMRILDGNGYMLALANGKVVGGFHDGTPRVLREPGPVRAGRWMHVALSWGDASISLYIDGKRRESSEYTGHPEFLARTVVVAERWTRNQRAFVGDLDEILFYDRRLDDAEILRLKEEGLFAGDPPSEDIPNVY